MPLPREQHNIPHPSRTNRDLNSRPPIHLHHALHTRLTNPHHHLIKYRHRILTTRIITSHHHQITPLPSNPPHLRPLRPIPIPTTPKHRNHSPAISLHQVPPQRNQILQRIIRMRIIHHHRKSRLFRSRHNFEPSWHRLQRRRRTLHFAQRQSASHCPAHRGHQVLDIYHPRQRRHNLHRPRRSHKSKSRPPRQNLNPFCAMIRVL